MKIFIFFSIFVFSSAQNLASQTWCPSGAVWHNQYSTLTSTGYYKTTYIGDTTIGTILCKVLDKKIYSYSSLTQLDTITLPHEYTYSDVDKVYIFRLNTFYTLYDFSASVGDTIVIPGTNQYTSCDSSGVVRVDSVGTMLINGLTLRYISVSPTLSSKWGWNARVVEKIGPIYNFNSSTFSYLFPIKLDYCGMMLDEFPEGGSLRCYQDDSFLLYSSGISSSCEYIATSIHEHDISETILIYPNPSSGVFNIAPNFAFSEDVVITVINTLGEVIMKDVLSGVSFSSHSIDLSLISPGIYFIEVANATEKIVQKINIIK